MGTLLLFLAFTVVSGNSRIHQGEVVPAGSTDYPYHAGVGIQQRHKTTPMTIRMGGSLISLRWNICIFQIAPLKEKKFLVPELLSPMQRILAGGASKSRWCMQGCSTHVPTL